MNALLINIITAGYGDDTTGKELKMKCSKFKMFLTWCFITFLIVFPPKAVNSDFLILKIIGWCFLYAYAFAFLWSSIVVLGKFLQKKGYIERTG